MATEPITTAQSTGLQPLADIVARGPEDQEPAPDFVANWHGENVEVTAVLQRTAVIAPLTDRWADKQVVRHRDLLVDPAAITWRPKPVAPGFGGRRRRGTPEQREAMRAASDRRPGPIRLVGPRPRRPGGRQGHRSAPRPVQPDAGTAASRPAAAALRQRPITAPVAPAAQRPAASTSRRPASTLASELRRARERIAELEAELEQHRAVALDVQRRVDVVVGRRAA